jgi:hypothetical protein
MYAIFLLALLADVARSHLPLPVGADSTGGLILSAASQLQAGSNDGAVLVLRRSNGSFPAVVRFKGYSLALSGWAKILSDQSTLAMLSTSASGPGAGTASPVLRLSQSTSPSRTIFEHTGSPAP